MSVTGQEPDPGSPLASEGAGLLRPLPELAARLHAADKAFFYSAFVVEERR